MRVVFACRQERDEFSSQMIEMWVPLACWCLRLRDRSFICRYEVGREADRDAGSICMRMKDKWVLFIDMSICDALGIAREPDRRNQKLKLICCLFLWRFHWIIQWMRCISVKQWCKFFMNRFFLPSVKVLYIVIAGIMSFFFSSQFLLCF